jgi:hypothetical protein
MKKKPISLLAVAAGGTLSFGIACAAWAVAWPVPQPMHISGQRRSPFTIYTDGIWMARESIARGKLPQANAGDA